MPVPVHAAKAQLSRLIDAALRGEDVVISRSDIPVVRLVPVVPRGRRAAFGALQGEIEVPDSFFDALPDDELDRWEGR